MNQMQNPTVRFQNKRRKKCKMMSESHWPDFNEHGDKEAESQKANRSAFFQNADLRKYRNRYWWREKKYPYDPAREISFSDARSVGCSLFFVLSSFLDIWFVFRSRRFLRFHRDKGLYENAQTVVNLMILQIYEQITTPARFLDQNHTKTLLSAQISHQNPQ